MEHLIEYLFYGVYATAFAFFLLVLYLNRTNRRLNFLLKKINILSGDDEDEGFPETHISRTRRRILKLIIKTKTALNSIRIRRYIYEYFLGANIITIIGSILFVLGIAFFVRFPVFGQYLDITARMVIAVGGSILLILISHAMHKNHPAFSSVIMGAAFGIMYFSFITGYYNYQLFGIQTAFIAAFIITAFAVTLSLIYKRYLLATLAFLAAYSTPFLTGYETTDSFLLFNYLIILNLGLLVQVSFKKSLFLNLTGFTFTGVYFMIWLITSAKTDYFYKFDTGFVYLVVFYIILILINSVSNIFQKKLFKPFELSVLITLNMLFYAAGMYMLNTLNPSYRGVFTGFQAIVNLIFLLLLLKYVKYNRNLIYLTIGLVVVFVTLIPPVELVGRSITMVWALQLILLLWISQKIDVVLMKLGAVLISIALITNTFIELWHVLNSINPLAAHKAILINTDFLSGSAAALSLIFSIFLMKREKGEYLFKPLKIKLYQIFAGVSAVILLYFSLYVETKYHVTTSVNSKYAQKVFMGIFQFSFILIPIIASAFIKNKKVKAASAAASFAIFIGYLFNYYFIAILARGEFIAGGGINITQFSSVFVVDIIMIIILFVTHLNSKYVFSNKRYLSQFTLWPLVVFIFISFSLALDHLWVIRYAQQGIMTSDLLEKVHLLPYTLLWSGLALMLTIAGTLFDIRQLRQLSVFAVSAVLMKLLLHDMASMNTRERTLAMIVVGSVLIIIALVYQFNQKKFEYPES